MACDEVRDMLLTNQDIITLNMTRPFSISCICRIIHGRGETNDQIIWRYSQSRYGNDYDNRRTKAFPYTDWREDDSVLEAKIFEIVIDEFASEHNHGRLIINGDVESDPLPSIYEIKYASGK